MVIAHQTFGDMLRWNPHFHAIVLEGGFDKEGTFFYIPFSGLQSMVEIFRRRVIKLLVQLELLNEDFARNLLSWEHSGFSQVAWASSNTQHCDQPSTTACASSMSPPRSASPSTLYGHRSRSKRSATVSLGSWASQTSRRSSL